MTKLHELFDQQGQSPWIDNLKRSYLTSGQLARMRDEGVRGVTSNPTIFAKAIESEGDYDAEFATIAGTASVEDAYWDLVVDDVKEALSILRPLYDSSKGGDGFVSLEVAPTLAHDTKGSIVAARDIHARVARPNLFVKIPATEEGVPAIHAMIAEGHNINVTLIFSIDRYGEVIEAYISGLEALAASGGDLSAVASVASFFVSRVDTEVDHRLEKLADPDAASVRGKAAVAQAKLAYQLFLQRFSGPRWQSLAAKGARVQRPLWASTSTKNPAYPDLLYVDNLIGPDTVNTMPDATLAAFADHGVLARTVDRAVEDAEATLSKLSRLGIEMSDVAQKLEDEGVAAFTKSSSELIRALETKASALAARR